MIPTASAINEYLCKPVDYPVYIDGIEFKSDLPLLVYDGNTYVPLRAVLEAAGLTVAWNTETNIANIYTEKETINHKPDAIKMTPDGIQAQYYEKLEYYIVFISGFKAAYKNTFYDIHKDINGKFCLYKNDEALLKDLVIPDKIIGFEYDYYCNTILPLIR